MRHDDTTRDALGEEARERIEAALTEPGGTGRTLLPAGLPRASALDELRALRQPRATEALELGSTLGQGGMGLVRSAIQRTLGRRVAVKSLPAEQRSAERDLRLLREAWLTAAVEHPNVVPIHDVIMDPEDGPLIVLKQVEGDSWADLIDDPVRVAERHGHDDLLEFNLTIFMQVCRALHYAHARSILHRDVKPANVMIGRFGEVYLLDWGIGVRLEDDPTDRYPRAGDGGLAGTLGYMCPDMLVNYGRMVSVKSDVYLLGATLYRIVAGRPPHQSEHTEELLTSIWTSRPRFPSGVSPALAAIVEKAMHPEPERRYASAEALRLAVQCYLRQRAALRIVDEVEPRVRELFRWLDEEGHSVAQRFQRFGECRLALTEAIRGSDGERARALLAELLDRMIDHLLRSDNPGGAAALLAEHPHPGDALRRRVDEAIAQRERRRDELARLEADEDPGVGRAARRTALVAMGGLWTVAPLLADVIDPAALPRTLRYLMPAGLLVLALAVWYRARASLAKTAINRRFLVALLAGFCAHMVHLLTVQIAALPPRSELAMGMVSFGAIGAVLAHTAERRLWPIVPLYWVGAVAAAGLRDHSALVLSFCNLLLTLFVLTIWSPRQRPDSRVDSAS